MFFRVLRLDVIVSSFSIRSDMSAGRRLSLPHITYLCLKPSVSCCPVKRVTYCSSSSVSSIFESSGSCCTNRAANAPLDASSTPVVNSAQLSVICSDSVVFFILPIVVLSCIITNSRLLPAHSRTPIHGGLHRPLSRDRQGSCRDARRDRQ